MNTLSNPEYPLLVLPQLATEIGLNEAIVLRQLHYWIQRCGKVRDGKLWIYNTIAQWHQQFSFWSERTIERVFASLKQMRLIFVERFDDRFWNQRNWYAINTERLEAFGISLDTATPERQPVATESVNLSPSTTETPSENIKTTTEEPRVVVFENPASEAEVQLTPNQQQILDEASELGVKSSKCLIEAIRCSSEEICRDALNALKEKKQQGKVKSPTAYLISAIRGRWTPNGTAERSAPTGFSNWFNQAYKEGLVRFSQLRDGVQWVCDRDYQWHSWEEFLSLKIP